MSHITVQFRGLKQLCIRSNELTLVDSFHTALFDEPESFDYAEWLRQSGVYHAGCRHHPVDQAEWLFAKEFVLYQSDDQGRRLLTRCLFHR